MMNFLNPKPSTLYAHCRGVGLLEAIVAIGVIVAGLIGVFTLVIGTSRSHRESLNRFIAVNLAREGIEVVRNIRDSNSLDSSRSPWDGILIDQNGIVASQLVPVFSPKNMPLEIWSLEPVTPDTAKVYTFDVTNGTETETYPIYVQGSRIANADESGKHSTIFERTLTIEEVKCAMVPQAGEIGCASLTITPTPTEPVRIGVRVRSTVWWSLRSQNVSMADTFYDWR